MKSVCKVEDGSYLTKISPIMTCIQTLKGSDAVWVDDGRKPARSITLKQLKSEQQVSKEDGFSFAVSLHDGSCVYTSNAITDHLGYPENMLSGQSMINYLLPKDHITFAKHLAQGLNDCYMQRTEDASHLLLNTFFCRFRVYQELNIASGSDVKAQYVPFKIILHVNDLVTDDESIENTTSTLCVTATATRISFTYSVPEEIPAMASFSTQHTASCYFSHVDPSAIHYLGFLPQDMIGYSMFDFYHIEDMPQMKDIYELVVKERGSVFRSKPYRFRVQNGCYISLETEWSCFINPWSHKIEFVMGQHRVLKGPLHIDMSSSPKDEEVIFSDEILKDSKNIQEEIITLLTGVTKTSDFEKRKRFCNKRKRDLAAFAHKNTDESLNAFKQKSNAEKQTEAMDDKSNSDYNSTVMGDISPYREIYDSSVSPETPPAVEQLRYQETIVRFFASQPKTYSDGSDDYTKNEKLSTADDSQVSSSGSGHGSGNTSASKCQKSSPAESPPQFNNNQNSTSSSSKCNMSSFTNGDSGYGKSFEKGTANNPSVSQAGSSNQMWSKAVDKSHVDQTTDSFSSCLALTQESIAVHNKINHKHSKQHWKTKPSLSTSTLKDKKRFQQKNSAKHKFSIAQTLSKSTPTQTEDILNELSKGNYYKNSMQKMPGLNENTVTTAGITNPYMYPSAPFQAPTPYFIPVMYMGGMPYYPSAPGSWQFGPAPPPTGSNTTQTLQKEYPACHFQFPNCQQPTYPKFNVENSFNEGPKVSVQASGSTTACTTTATVYSDGVSNFKKSIAKCKTSKSIERVLLSDSFLVTNFEKQNNEPTSPLSDMQAEGSLSSLFTQSSSLQSPDKHEEMDSDKEKPGFASPPKMELTSDIAYRYQMNTLSVDDILKKDREALMSFQQPELVNKQLKMLQLEREEENKKKLRASDNDFSMTEDVMLGMTLEDGMNKVS